MSLIKTIGYVHPEIIYKLCHKYYPFMDFSFSTYARGRREISFGYHVPITPTPTISEGERDNLVTQLGNLYYPCWDAASLCLYPLGVGMSWHRDHKACNRIVVLVNIGHATFRITKQEVVLDKDIEVYDLEDGEVIRFDSKLLHQIDPVKHQRWSLTFRQLKPKYLP